MLPLKNLRRIAKHVARGFSEVQSKTRAATSNDPQSPSDKQIDELLRMSFRGDLCDELMDTLFKRLEERGKSWKHVYKALIIIDHILRAGSERALSCCLKNVSVFEALQEFSYFETDGTDRGSDINVKAIEVLHLLQNPHSLNQQRRIRPLLKTTKSSPSLTSSGVATNVPRRKASLMESSLIDVDVGNGTGSIHLDVGTVDMVFGTITEEPVEVDENSGRRSEGSHSRGSSTAFFDPEVILIIDHRGLGMPNRESAEPEAEEEDGEGSDAAGSWVSQLDAETESKQQELEGDVDGAERSLRSSSHSRRLSGDSYQSFDSGYTHSSWFAGLSILRHSHDSDDDSDTDGDGDDDNQRRHERVVNFPRPSAPTPGLSPTRESDSEGSSSAMSTRLPTSPARSVLPIKLASPISPISPILPISPKHTYYPTLKHAKTFHHHNPSDHSNFSNASSPSKRSIRPLPTPPRRPSEPYLNSDSEADASDAERERLKALRKLHSALPLDEAEIPKILSTQNMKRKPRPLPAVPAVVE